MADTTKTYRLALEFVTDAARKGADAVARSLSGVQKALDKVKKAGEKAFGWATTAASKLFSLRNVLTGILSGALLDRFFQAGERLNQARAMLGAIPGETAASAEQLYNMLDEVSTRTGKSIEEMTRQLAKVMSGPASFTMIGEMLQQTITPEMTKTVLELEKAGRTDLYRDLVRGMLADRIRELSQAQGAPYGSMKSSFSRLTAEVSSIAATALAPLFNAASAKMDEWRAKARASKDGVVNFFQVTLMGWLDRAYAIIVQIIARIRYELESVATHFQYIADSVEHLASFRWEGWGKGFGFTVERPTRQKREPWQAYFQQHGGWEEALGPPTPFTSFMRGGGTGAWTGAGIPTADSVMQRILALVGMGGGAGQAGAAGAQTGVGGKLFSSIDRVLTKVKKTGTGVGEEIKDMWFGAMDQAGQAGMRMLVGLEKGTKEMFKRLAKELLASTLWQLLLTVLGAITGGSSLFGGGKGKGVAGGTGSLGGKGKGIAGLGAVGTGNDLGITLSMHETLPNTYAVINRRYIYPSTQRVLQLTTRQLSKGMA